jgi:flavin reductase (DIM6/NTAB) family NADH-FMN oxidoreductase RutF
VREYCRDGWKPDYNTEEEVRIDPATLSPGRRYFLLISCIIPRPIAWVGTVNADGGHSLAPFSFFNGLSGTPPIIGIGFAPHEEKREKDTLRNVRRTGELVVNIANFDQVRQVDESGDDLPYGTDEFVYTGLTPLPGEFVSAPRVAEAQISMECVVYQVVPLGTQGSTLLLAEVKLFHILDTLIDDRGCVDPHKFKALARMSGGRYAPVGEVFKVDRS